MRFFWVREGTLTTTTLTEMPRSVAATPCSHDLVAKIQEFVDIDPSMSVRAIAAVTHTHPLPSTPLRPTLLCVHFYYAISAREIMVIFSYNFGVFDH